MALMQAIETFVVKVLRDHADPEALRGLLTCVATGDQFPYADGAALLELLRHVGGAPEPLQVAPSVDTGRDLRRKQ